MDVLPLIDDNLGRNRHHHHLPLKVIYDVAHVLSRCFQAGWEPETTFAKQCKDKNATTRLTGVCVCVYEDVCGYVCVWQAVSLVSHFVSFCRLALFATPPSAPSPPPLLHEHTYTHTHTQRSK